MRGLKVTIVICGVALWAGMAVTGVCAATADTRAQVPLATSPAMKESKALIRDLFKAEFANRKPEARLALSKKLLGQAIETGDDPTARYVLFLEAQKLAVDAGNLEVAMSTVQSMAKYYKVDEVKSKSAILRKVASKIRTDEGQKLLAENYLAVAQAAVAKDDFMGASSMLTSAQSAARKAKSLPLMAKAKKLSLEIRKLQTEFNRVRSFEKQLKQNPDDPKANYAMGKYTCFVKADWDRGLAYFKKGSHAGLAAVAIKELSGTTLPKEQVALGEAWFDLAGKERDVKGKVCMQKRAAYWYGKAIKNLSGLSKLKVKKRLIAIRLTEGPKKVYLCMLSEVGIKSGYGKLGKNGELGYEGKKVSVKGVKLKNSLSQNPPAKDYAAISYVLGMRFKTLSGSVGINDAAKPKSASPLTFKILGDGKELWASTPREKPGSSQPFRVDVTGVEGVEIQIHCPGANSFAQAIWIDPVLSK